MDAADGRSAPLVEEAAGEIGGILREYFGRDEFSPLELQVVHDLETGKDVVLPSKSDPSALWAAQIVAACHFKGTMVVVSERVEVVSAFIDHVRERYLQTAFVHFDLEKERIAELEAQFASKSLKVVGVTPAKLLSLTFQRIARLIPISFICVDDTISPLAAERIAAFLPSVPRLSIGPLAVVRQQREAPKVDVPALSVEIRNGLREQVFALLQNGVGNGVVYCRSDNAAAEMARWLPRGRGVQCFAVTGDLDARRKAEVLDDFARNVGVLAIKSGEEFDLGAAEVHWTIHAGLPCDESTMFREIRAGGRSASAAFIFDLTDVEAQTLAVAAADLSTEEKIRAMGAFRSVLGVVTATGCRTRRLAEAVGHKPTAKCGVCDNCRETSPLLDATEDAGRVLAAVEATPGCTLAVLMKSLDVADRESRMRLERVVARLFAERHLLMRKNGVLSVGDDAREIRERRLVVEIRSPSA